jgi:putative cell wall-binding protein
MPNARNARARRSARPTGARRKRRATRYWSRRVTEGSDALDLESGVFTLHDPRRIAASLKRSAEASTRRKGTPYQSAMSMLTFFINRAGTKLTAKQLRVLERAKRELRILFGRE